jgi:hypothetical protein
MVQRLREVEGSDTSPRVATAVNRQLRGQILRKKIVRDSEQPKGRRRPPAMAVRRRPSMADYSSVVACPDMRRTEKTA